jgi:hypothetical protein
MCVCVLCMCAWFDRVICGVCLHVYMVARASVFASACKLTCHQSQERTVFVRTRLAAAHVTHAHVTRLLPRPLAPLLALTHSPSQPDPRFTGSSDALRALREFQGTVKLLDDVAEDSVGGNFDDSIVKLGFSGPGPGRFQSAWRRKAAGPVRGLATPRGRSQRWLRRRGRQDRRPRRREAGGRVSPSRPPRSRAPIVARRCID